MRYQCSGDNHSAALGVAYQLVFLRLVCLCCELAEPVPNHAIKQGTQHLVGCVVLGVGERRVGAVVGEMFTLLGSDAFNDAAVSPWSCRGCFLHCPT